MQQLESGVVLANRYTLVRKLGNGVGTEVWLANDRMTRAEVALKIVSDANLSGAMLRREWQTSIRLMHPHIVRVFEFHPATDAGADFFSLQFVDGPSIAALTGATVDEILAPLALVADALRYAHGKNVIHCDIKADNVLLDRNGAPYIIDFGVAANREGYAGGGSLIAATPQLLAGDDPQPADDIFALGGLIYELVSGASPYSSAQAGDDIRHRIPERLLSADGKPVASDIQQLVADMLHKDVAARPDASQVVERIRAAGIEPGQAPLRLRDTAREIRDEVIDTQVTRRRSETPDLPASVSRDRQGGLNPRTVGIVLSLLVLALLAVIFLLPEMTNREGAAPPVEVVDAEPEPRNAATTEEALPERDVRVQDRAATEEVLGELLAKVRTLEARAVERWGGISWKKVSDAYAAGDAAYLKQDYETATAQYEQALKEIDPLLERVDDVFNETLADAVTALENGDAAEALRLFELAVAITPAHSRAKAGLLRAQNLEQVMSLTDQGLAHERQQDFEAAQESFARAVEIDPEWEPAQNALARVKGTIRQNSFDMRMTEGHAALAANNYIAARAAFRAAKELLPESAAPDDGLLQVDQGMRLNSIGDLQARAEREVANEQWQAAAETYESILELDDNLDFAHQGLAKATEMIALHKRLDDYIQEPDKLSADRTMNQATQLVVDITRMPNVGPRLAAQRDDLARLLKRAATPLTVTLVSDNKTNVSVYRVAKLGTFESTELTLRPGTYVAVGSRPGYRDVRMEFRVAPELDMQPVVIRCEELI